MFIGSYFRNVFDSRYILISLVQRDLKNRYRKSFLGGLWSVLTPLGLVLIIGTVYSIIWGQDPKIFIPRLFTGLTPWLFITASAEGGAMSFAAAEGYIKQTTTNIEIFPLRSASVALVNYLYSAGAFFLVYLFLSPEKYSWKMLMAVPGILILYVFGAGLATIAGIVNSHVRDFQPLQSLILQGLFYATPIIYPTEMLDKKGYSLIYQLNPFYYLIRVVKAPMTGDALPTGQEYLIAILIAMLIALAGIYLVRRMGRKLVFVL